MPDITPQTIELAVALAKMLLSLMDGSKTAAQVAQEINDQTLANSKWLADRGFFPAEHGGVTLDAYERVTSGTYGCGGEGTSVPLQSQVQQSWPYTFGPSKTDVAIGIVKFFMDAGLLERDPDVNKFIDLVKQVASLL